MQRFVVITMIIIVGSMLFAPIMLGFFRRMSGRGPGSGRDRRP